MREVDPCNECRQRLFAKVVRFGEVSYSSWSVTEDGIHHTVNECLKMVVRQRDGAEAALSIQTEKVIKLTQLVGNVGGSQDNCC